MMENNGIIRKLTERKSDIRNADVLQHARQRVQAAAEELSRRGAAAASAELCNEAISRLMDLTYETDQTGPCNRDPQTGRLLVPVPWGRNGRYKFGLRATEADVLRIHMYKLMDLRRPAPLYTYDPACRSWFNNHFDYETIEQAYTYWKMTQLDASTYRNLADSVRKQRR